MKNSNKFLIGLIFMIGIIVEMCYAGECDTDEFARCSEPLDRLQLSPEFQIGKKEQLNDLCIELKNGLRCIQSYTRRCFDMDQRNHFNKMYYGTNQFIRDLCIEGSFQDEYLRHISCSEVARNEFEVCAKRYKDAMIFISNPSPNQKKEENLTLADNIKTICCSYQELIECSHQVAKKKCGDDAAKFVKDLLGRFGTNLVKLHCDSYSRNPGLCGLSSATSLVQFSITTTTFLSLLLISLLSVIR